MFRVVIVLCVVSVWLPILAGTAQAERWDIVAGHDGTEVRFLSRATMESFEGATRQVEGWILLDSGDSISWRVSVDLASLDTGIGLRNRHMRENHLHTNEFPEAVFSGSAVLPEAAGRLEPGSEIDLEFSGAFELHGVTRDREIPVRLTRAPDGSLEAQASFEVSLADHDIPLPKFLMLKLADMQEVRVQFFARNE